MFTLNPLQVQVALQDICPPYSGSSFQASILDFSISTWYFLVYHVRRKMENNTPAFNCFPQKGHVSFLVLVFWLELVTLFHSTNGGAGKHSLPPVWGGEENWKYQWALVTSITTSKYTVLVSFGTRAAESSLNLTNNVIEHRQECYHMGVGFPCLVFSCSVGMVSLKVNKSSTWYNPDIARNGFVFFPAQNFLPKIIPLMLSLLFLPSNKERSELTYFSLFNPKFPLYKECLFSDYKNSMQREKSIEPIFPCSLRKFCPLSFLKLKQLWSLHWLKQYSLLITHQCIIHTAS